MRFLAGINLLILIVAATSAHADHAETAWAKASPSVVSVLPIWPGYEKPGLGALPGTAPEGSGVAVMGEGVILTAGHVVANATSVQVRDHDGTVLDVEVLAVDGASDLALLRVDAAIPPIALASKRPAPGAHTCLIANAFGLGLSVTCGIVSADRRTGIGFNPIEDFIQTDAAANPGSSGGALVNEAGELVGLMSAIFTMQSDANAGVNFAASVDLIKVRIEWMRARFGLTNLE